MYKQISIAVTSCVILSSANAVDLNDKFFAAYQVAQSSNLPQSIQRQVLLPDTMDRIALATLERLNRTSDINRYKNDRNFKQKVQNAVQNYLNSKDAVNFYDDAATKIYNQLYTLDELKAQYHLNNSKQGKEFLKANTIIQENVRKKLDEHTSAQFNSASNQKLEIQIQEILNKIAPQVEAPESEIVKAEVAESNISIAVTPRVAEVAPNQVTPKVNDDNNSQNNTELVENIHDQSAKDATTEAKTVISNPNNEETKLPENKVLEIKSEVTQGENNNTADNVQKVTTELKAEVDASIASLATHDDELKENANTAITESQNKQQDQPITVVPDSVISDKAEKVEEQKVDVSTDIQSSQKTAEVDLDKEQIAESDVQSQVGLSVQITNQNNDENSINTSNEATNPEAENVVLEQTTPAINKTQLEGGSDTQSLSPEQQAQKAAEVIATEVVEE